VRIRGYFSKAKGVRDKNICETLLWASEESWLGCRQVQETFLFYWAPSTALEPTLASYSVATEDLKQPGPETDHSPSSSDEIKNAWSHNSIPPFIFTICLRRTLHFTFKNRGWIWTGVLKRKEKDGQEWMETPLSEN